MRPPSTKHSDIRVEQNNLIRYECTETCSFDIHINSYEMVVVQEREKEDKTVWKVCVLIRDIFILSSVIKYSYRPGLQKFECRLNIGHDVTITEFIIGCTFNPPQVSFRKTFSSETHYQYSDCFSSRSSSNTSIGTNNALQKYCLVIWKCQQPYFQTWFLCCLHLNSF